MREGGGCGGGWIGGRGIESSEGRGSTVVKIGTFLKTHFGGQYMELSFDVFTPCNVLVMYATKTQSFITASPSFRTCASYRLEIKVNLLIVGSKSETLVSEL